MGVSRQYVDAVNALSTTYLAKLSTGPNFNEQKFVTDMAIKIGKGFDLSPKMKAVIDKLVRRYVEGRDDRPQERNDRHDRDPSPVEQEPIERGRFQAHKASGGFQIYIDKNAVGGPVDYKSAVNIIYWLEDCIDDLMAGSGANEDPDNLPVEGGTAPF